MADLPTELRATEESFVREARISEYTHHPAVAARIRDFDPASSQGEAERGREGVSEWERDPLGHAVRLLWVIETRYLAASTRERRKIALELQEAKEEVVSVAVQLEIEKEVASMPRTGGPK